MKPKILLVGKNGQLGRELSVMLPTVGDVESLGREELDLSQADAIRRVIRNSCPDVIVNAAAYTAVDRAESDEASAWAVNALAPAIMAEEAGKIGALFIHYSTDYVFDGQKQAPYVEEDQTNPLNTYGRTKLAGECAIRQAGGSYLIFRTAWVYAREGKNFLLTVLRLATEREELRIVDDQIGAPTSSHDIASASTRILAGLYAANPGHLSAVSGIYHLTAAGETTWCGFAKAILESVSLPTSIPWLSHATRNRPVIARRVIGIRTEDYPTPARRPAYSILSNARLDRVFGVRLPPWQQQLQSVFSRT